MQMEKYDADATRGGPSLELSRNGFKALHTELRQNLGLEKDRIDYQFRNDSVLNVMSAEDRFRNMGIFLHGSWLRHRERCHTVGEDSR